MSADRRFEDYEPSYRFAYDAANRIAAANSPTSSPVCARSGISMKGRGSPPGKTSKSLFATRGTR